jgi:hypothetical protein
MECIREINESLVPSWMRLLTSVVYLESGFLRTEVLGMTMTSNDKVSDDHFDTAANCRTVLIKVVVARVRVRSRR